MFRLSKLAVCALTIGATLLAAAPSAAAAPCTTTAALDASYTEHFGGPTGAAPTGGSGKDVTFGTFTEELVSGPGRYLTRILTFEDGSTLILRESFESFSSPGNFEGNPNSYGNPGTVVFSFKVVGGTGVFAGASGSGTDTITFAGDVGQGTLTGTITLKC
jgi:hypothetical protein